MTERAPLTPLFLTAAEREEYQRTQERIEDIDELHEVVEYLVNQGLEDLAATVLKVANQIDPRGPKR